MRVFLATTALLCGGLAACGGNDEEGAKDVAERASAEREATSVRVDPVRQQTVQTWVFGEGTARAVAREFLSFESAGRIAYVDPELKEGDPVEAGQMIAYQQQDRPEAELAAARSRLVDARTQKATSEASLAEARAGLELAENTYQRFQRLAEQDSASPQEVEEARVQLEQARAAMVRAERQLAASDAQIAAARAQLATAEIVEDESQIVSPMNGVLARLNIEQGFYFSPQQIQSTSEAGALRTVPVVIIDPSAFEISISLPSYAFERVEVGRPVLITPERGQDTRNSEGPRRDPADYAIRGEVYAVSPSVDPDTRTFVVKVRTTIGADRLQDGSFVTTWIAGPAISDTLAIPLSAVRYSDNEPFAFVAVEGNGEAERRALELGLRGRAVQQVLAGVEEGERVVTDGLGGLSDGDSIRIIADQQNVSQADE